MFSSDSIIVSTPVLQQPAEVVVQGEKAIDTPAVVKETVGQVKETVGKTKEKNATTSDSTAKSKVREKQVSPTPEQTSVQTDSTSFAAQVATDSLVQTAEVKYQPAPIVWQDFVDGYVDNNLLGRSVFQKDSTSGKIYIDKSVWRDRIAGESQPYLLRTDDGVAGALLLLFISCLMIAVYAKRYLGNTIKHFFEKKRHNTIFEDSDDTQMRGRSLLVLQAAVALGILLFNHFHADTLSSLERIPTLILLGANIAICYILLLGKIFIYNSVNRTLFSPEQRRSWHEGYVLILMCAGLLLMPVAILSLYSQIDVNTQLRFVILIGIFCEILLFYKTFRTFFNNGLGYLHLILYFCALEITPYLILWSISTYTNQIIIDL
ncbi:MAG: DUF4271 domain-containing protein [Bacteroidaceae bacterium]|nr:DUF4271 domain-containing protein [Bacteroidaceae bacterium]